MRRWLLASLAALLTVSGCLPVAHLGERPALPTAVAGEAATEAAIGTPVAKRARAAAGLTSTPAPWATPLPPESRPAPVKVGHPVAATTDCLKCHRGGMSYMPPDHYRRKNGTCLGCHEASSAGEAVGEANFPASEPPAGDE